MSLDVAAARARFSALQRELVFFDGPGGTQVPDEVIDAIAGYLRESNANTSGPYETSRRTEALVTRARLTAAAFLGCAPDETIFGPNMTTLSFALSRTAGRELRAGDEILVTKLDHDANVSPWLELAHDRDLVVRFVDIHDDTSLDLDDLERQLGERTRVVAFPLASNAVGTLTDVRRIVRLAHEAGALAWADAVHYGPHGPIDVAELGVDVLICSPYKYFGPHLGLAFGRQRADRDVATVQGAPRAERAPRPPLRDGNPAVRAPRRVRRRGRVHRVARLGGHHRLGARARVAVPRRAAGDDPVPRPADDGRTRAHVRLLRRRSSEPPRQPRGSASGASPSGTATTTRSR